MRMQLRFLWLFLGLGCGFLSAQTDENEIVLDPAEVGFLYNYYEQDGQNAAVTGGKGTEFLKNSAQLVTISLPINYKSKVSAVMGLDTYTSASTANIDKYSTGASNSGLSSIAAKDTRKHIDIAYNEQVSELFGITALGGYSKEYDVTSYNVGLSANKISSDGNHKFSFALGGYFDDWLLIYPGEIRDPSSIARYINQLNNNNGNTGASGNYGYTGASGNYGNTGASDDDDDDYKYRWYPSYPNYPYNPNPYLNTQSTGNQQVSNTDYKSKMRYTYNANVAYEVVLGKKTNAQIIVDYTRQYGILYTPFHRVYFKDGVSNEIQKIVKSEFLPDSRNKFAIGVKVNQYISPMFVLRAYYRYYQDSFEVSGHTFEVEIPIRVSRTLSFYPFFRYYTQLQSKYFAPYGEHSLWAKYYTSDYDLSSFSSFSRGIGVNFSPVNGFFKIQRGKKGYFSMKGIQLRYSTYERTSGLEASSFSISTDFTLK